MGGFFDSSKGEVVLPPDLTSPRNALYEYDLIIREGGIPLVRTVGTSEKEIRDRSKGDALAKLIVVLQTLWFIAQYLGRWFDHLPRTQLEVMTLAYAALAVAVYRLWWHNLSTFSSQLTYRDLTTLRHRLSTLVLKCSISNDYRHPGKLIGRWCS
jgi:hypothetical protein